MRPANNAPIFAGMYKELAEIARKHGYALAIHGSLIRDFDIICIPWREDISTPEEVLKAFGEEFVITHVHGPERKNHGRIAYTVAFSFGDCFIDLSFTPTSGVP